MLPESYPDGVAKILQTPDKALGLRGLGAAVEVTGAEILVEGAVLEHVIDGGQDRGGERADGFLGAAWGAQTIELRLEIAGPSCGRRPRRIARG